MFYYYFSNIPEYTCCYNNDEVQCLIDDIYEEFSSSTLFSKDESLIIKFVNEGKEDTITIPEIYDAFEDYLPESWRDYCIRVNAQFYLGDCGIEDRENHVDKYDEQESRKMEEFKNQLLSIINRKKEPSNSSSERKYYFTINHAEDRDNDVYEKSEILLKNVEDNTSELIKLKLNYSAICDQSEYYNRGYRNPMNHWRKTNKSYVFRIRDDNTYNSFYINKTLYTKEEVEEIKEKFQFKQEKINKDHHEPLYLVDIELFKNGYKFYFGTKKQFDKSYGDDWNDAPYDCNAGPVYEEYVTYTWDWMPVNETFIRPIEEYLCYELNTKIDKFMMKRGIVPAIIISKDQCYCADREHKEDYPIFFGMTIEELDKIINKVS